MITIIDISMFTVIDEIALQKTRHLRKHYAFLRQGGTKEEASRFYLQRLVSDRIEEIPDRIVAVFAELGRAHFADQNDVQTIGSTQVHISQFVWGRMCVLAYFFFHDEPAWQNLLFRKLDEHITVPELAEDVLTAKGLIDEYYKERALLSGEAAAAPEPSSAMQIAKEAATPATTPKPEDIFSFSFQRTSDYQRMLEVLEAEKKDCSDIEWARHALTIYRHKYAFVKRPGGFSKWLAIFGEMFGRKVAYREPNKLDMNQNAVSLEPFLPR
ncbi:MAG: hypothetical protein IJS49_04565 [Paludibacteraceae bacterium]|nr:hypothetical protein [Paludibacteraceae bacterium]